MLKIVHRSEYLAYCNARLRCNSKKNMNYPDYGGRGILFLFRSFEEFFSCMGPRPDGMVLDRINNDGHYEPGNCRWATLSQSSKNKRPRKTYGPRPKKNTERNLEIALMAQSGSSLAEIAKAFSLSYSNISNILKRELPDSHRIVIFSRNIERNRKIVCLARSGNRQVDIAREFGIKQGTVSRILRRDMLDNRNIIKEYAESCLTH